MEIFMKLEGGPNRLNYPLDKKSLTYSDSVRDEENSEIKFTFYDQSDTKIGDFEGFLGEEKAVLEIVRAHFLDKSLIPQALKMVLDYAYDPEKIKHNVLRCDFEVVESGVKDRQLFKCGFFSINTPAGVEGSPYLYHLNPDFEGMITGNTNDTEIKEKLLTKCRAFYQKREEYLKRFYNLRLSLLNNKNIYANDIYIMSN